MARMHIEVVYATPQCQEIVEIDLEEGARAADALRESSLPERYPNVDFSILKLGIFGKEVSLDALLADGDRVEVYRPLSIDPKEARRAKARRTSRRV